MESDSRSFSKRLLFALEVPSEEAPQFRTVPLRTKRLMTFAGVTMPEPTPFPTNAKPYRSMVTSLAETVIPFA